MSGHARTQDTAFARQDLSRLWTPFCLAQEVGQGLGERTLLQRALPEAQKGPARDHESQLT